MGTAFLMRSLALLFVLVVSACDRRSSLSEQSQTLPVPMPLPADVSLDPAAPEPSAVAANDLALDPEALARTVRDRFRKPTPFRVESNIEPAALGRRGHPF
jgi:hypothetical protein